MPFSAVKDVPSELEHHLDALTESTGTTAALETRE